MSARNHEQSAEHEAGLAARHEEQFDPDASSGGGGGCLSFCFGTWSNPTAEHARDARKHRALASKHRRASAALREAEERSCEGIPERERDVSPFFHTADIASVQPQKEDDGSASYIVRFAPVTGLDAAGMQRLVNCHVARNAVLGHDVPEMEYCPLVPKGVEATVESDGPAVLVRLEATDPASALELRTRVGRLMSHSSRPATPTTPRGDE